MTWGPFFFPHQVLVRNLQLAGGMGATHTAARTLAAEVLDTQTLSETRTAARSSPQPG